MVRIKIKSNPYQQEISFTIWDEKIQKWRAISYENNHNSSLIADDLSKSFFPFKVQEIIETLIKEYGRNIQLVFEGNQDEFRELKSVCQKFSSDPIVLSRSEFYLANAPEILPEVEDIFQKTLPLIPNDLKNGDVAKFQEVLSHQIPLVIVGSYSSGKSTFINALIGYDLLPNSDSPATAKIFKIAKGEKESPLEIYFKVDNEPINIFLTDESFQIDGKSYLDSIPELKSELEGLTGNLEEKASKLLKLLNQLLDVRISSLISIRIPFRQGILSQSDYDFVIFDTPGSNSSSNKDHLNILRESMAKMSNGLLVFISEKDNLDTNDNESLYRDLKEVKGIDDRFTLIVVNKADDADLPKEGFSENDVKALLDQSVPKNLNSEGIYFVSSIMALGYKCSDQFQSENYDRVYKKNLEVFSNEANEYYQELYKYNIQPLHLKSEALEKAQLSSAPLVYLNSGLYTLEAEIHNFASNYSTYNKCQQAQIYLTEILKQTESEIITLGKQANDELRDLKQQLEENKARLNQHLAGEKARLEKHFLDEQTQSLEKSVSDENLTISERELSDFTEGIYQQIKNDSHLDDLEEAISDKTKSLKGMFDFRKLREDTQKQINQIYFIGKDRFESSKNYKERKNQVFKEVSELIILHAQENYKEKLLQIREKLFTNSVDTWERAAKTSKDNFATIIKNSEIFPEETKEGIEQLIYDFDNIPFEIRSRLLENKNLFQGIKLGDLYLFGNHNKVDFKKLSRLYEKVMNDDIAQLKENFQSYYRENLSTWLNKLYRLVSENIIEFNPNLRETNEKIIQINQKIRDYEDKENQLKEFQQKIDDLLTWKVKGEEE